MNPHPKLIIVVGSVVNCEKKENLKFANNIENLMPKKHVSFMDNKIWSITCDKAYDMLGLYLPLNALSSVIRNTNAGVDYRTSDRLLRDRRFIMQNLVMKSDNNNS